VGQRTYLNDYFKLTLWVPYMNVLKNIYTSIVNHLGKLLSTLGAVLFSVDITEYGDQLRAYAAQYLGPGADKKIGVVIFGLLIARTWYTGWKASQITAALSTVTIEPPVPPILVPTESKPASGG
jgi:hypothetical protein